MAYAIGKKMKSKLTNAATNIGRKGAKEGLEEAASSLVRKAASATKKSPSIGSSSNKASGSSGKSLKTAPPQKAPKKLYK